MVIEAYKRWLVLWLEKVIAEKEALNTLDADIGDGDFGDNITLGANDVLKALDEETFASVDALFKRVALIFMGSMGSTSGIILGSAFLEMSKKAAESDDLAEILYAGSMGIQLRGKSGLGDKTMLDMWLPLTQAYSDNQLDEEFIESKLQRVKAMQAKQGRAADYSDTTVGKQDPGALAVAYLFKSLLDI